MGEGLKNETSRKECLDTIKQEYVLVIDNANRLDNKVNVALTFCGVFFIFLLDLFKLKDVILLPISNSMVLFHAITYLILMLVVLGLYISSIILLISIIKPSKRGAIPPEDLVTDNFYDTECSDIYIYLAVKYCEAVNTNRDINNYKYKRFNISLILIMILIILSLILYAMKYTFC